MADEIKVLNLDLDAILQKVMSGKTTAKGGPSPSGLTSKIIDQLKPLIAAATAAKIEKLPFRSTVKQIAIALGAPEDKRTQFYYHLSEQVREKLAETKEIEVVKDGRAAFLICK